MKRSQPGKVLMLRAPSGKWVSGPGKGKAMVSLAKASDPTLMFELLKNPKAVARAKSSKPVAKPGAKR